MWIYREGTKNFTYKGSRSTINTINLELGGVIEYAYNFRGYLKNF